MKAAETTAPEQETDFTEFVRAVAPELLSYFARRVLPAEDAADCLSETLLVLWRRVEKFPPAHGERRAWAYGIAHKVLLAQRRHGSRQISIAARLRDEIRTNPIAPASHDDDAIAALATLKAQDRELVGLIVWEGLSIKEAAAVIGIRPEAARARYSRARRTLRMALSR